MVGDLNRYQQISMTDGMASGKMTGGGAASDMAGMMMGMNVANQMLNQMNQNQQAQTPTPQTRRRQRQSRTSFRTAGRSLCSGGIDLDTSKVGIFFVNEGFHCRHDRRQTKPENRWSRS
ncbi:hypothetical protein P9D47_06165 [Bacillus haynesii]|nr:hypothetical protein [Bacillus haynesii]MEC0672070.1 hypothetical protein [Bacillus haynesii]MEC1420250.1 hypothetical protein [Bacillus haynesii]MEC1467631.1 hypothetical protein [Bacillus haynesii]